MTKKSFILTAALMLMLMASTHVSAQVSYAFYKNGTLTFYYDNNQDNRTGGTVYAIPEGGFPWGTKPGWYTDHGGDITKVVFASTFSETKPKSMAYWFSGLKNLEEITDMKYLNTSEVESMSWMFNGCSGLTSLDVSGFDTGNVTSMDGMFYGCSGLTSLDVSGFDTQNVTYMGGMFYNCRRLTSLDVSGFDTQNVTEISGMFQSCSGLTSLDVSGFDTQNVTYMGGMFYNCRRLTSLDVSGFDTQNVTEISGMFQSCSGLTSLDVSGFDTQNVTLMYSMFYGCSGLTSLDVSGFDTGNVTNMTYMFYDCNRLTTIYCGSNWKTDNVQTSGQMFSKCSHLVGAQGTAYDENHTDAEYARVDGGPSAPGYFTYKHQIPTKVENVTTQSEQKIVTYDLQGRRVQGAARKGIYVMNGKKVVR